MSNKKFNDRIIRYLNNELNSAEKAEFENELDSNEELSEAFFEFIADVKIKHDIGKLVKENSPTPEEARRKYKKRDFSFIIKIAAAILIVLIPSVFLINNYVFSDDTLITNENMSYPSGSIFRGDSEVGITAQKHAFSLYQKKKFTEAATIFTAIADTAANAAKYELYAGINLVWSGDKDKLNRAKIYLDKAINSETNYSTAASWFYAIALFETDEKGEAKKIFERFANNDSSNYMKKEAIEILDDKY